MRDCLLHALFTGLQAHADGGGKGDLPIGTAVAVGIMVVFGPCPGNVGGLFFHRRGQNHSGVGAVSKDVSAKRLFHKSLCVMWKLAAEKV